MVKKTHIHRRSGTKTGNRTGRTGWHPHLNFTGSCWTSRKVAHQIARDRQGSRGRGHTARHHKGLA